MFLMLSKAVTEGKNIALNLAIVSLNLLLSILVVIWAVALTKSDPSFKKELDKAVVLPCKIVPQFDLSFICGKCDIKVPDECQHCGYCHRCVKGFDHHCDFINNCIGTSNYSMFFTLSILFTLQGFS